MFLGTPHSGTSDANVGELLLSLAGTFTGLNTGLTRMLSPDSEGFKAALKGWHSSYWTLKPPLVCFAEQQPTKLKFVAGVRKLSRRAIVGTYSIH